MSEDKRMTISDEAVEAAARVHQDLVARGGYPKWDELLSGGHPWRLDYMRAALEAAAPHIATQRAVDAVVRLHREMPCLDEEGDPVGGSYCEECKDLDDHAGERVHEVYPCMTVREIRKALAGQESFASMRDRIEAPYRSAGAGE